MVKNTSNNELVDDYELILDDVVNLAFEIDDEVYAEKLCDLDVYHANLLECIKQQQIKSGKALIAELLSIYEAIKNEPGYGYFRELYSKTATDLPKILYKLIDKNILKAFIPQYEVTSNFKNFTSLTKEEQNIFLVIKNSKPMTETEISKNLTKSLAVINKDGFLEKQTRDQMESMSNLKGNLYKILKSLAEKGVLSVTQRQLHAEKSQIKVYAPSFKGWSSSKR